jgi:hypothetical protein
MRQYCEIIHEEMRTVREIGYPIFFQKKVLLSVLSMYSGGKTIGED